MSSGGSDRWPALRGETVVLLAALAILACVLVAVGVDVAGPQHGA
jgi:hypothetical protein